MAKNVFQVHGIDDTGRIIVRRSLRRRQMMPFFGKLEPCLIGIELIAAYSPEARGRSERAFGTLQGRLPQELRVAGVTTMEQANR